MVVVMMGFLCEKGLNEEKLFGEVNYLIISFFWFYDDCVKIFYFGEIGFGVEWIRSILGKIFDLGCLMIINVDVMYL